MSIILREKVAELRGKLGLTRAEFCEKVGIPNGTLVSIELRGNAPGAEIITKIVEAFPQYALWLTTGEIEHIAGQFEPGVVDMSDSIFQIVDSVDARNIDQIMVNSKLIKEVIFLQSVGDGFFVDIAGAKVSVESSKQVNRKFDFAAKKRDSFVFGIPQHFGTAILLVLSKRENRNFPRAVLVKDDSFDLKESIGGGSKSNTFSSVQKWFKDAGINKFDIGTIHYKTLRILESESDELKLSDIYPSADDDAIKSLVEWRKSFK